MRVLVTGAAGKIGRAVCAQLAADGFDVRATDRRTHREVPVRVDVAELLEPTAAYRLLDGCEAVVHLANHPGFFQIGPQRGLTENVATNANVFQAAHELGVRRIVFASSVQAFTGSRVQHGPDDPLPPSRLAYLPMDGELPQMAGNAYALSKVLGEQMLAYYAREHGMSCVAARFPATMPKAHFPDRPRPGQRRRGGNLDEAMTLLSTEDAARFASAVLKADLPGYRAYFPTARRPGAVGVPVASLRAELFPDVPLRPGFADPLSSFVDHSRITRETGWEPPDEVPEG